MCDSYVYYFVLLNFVFFITSCMDPENIFRGRWGGGWVVVPEG